MIRESVAFSRMFGRLVLMICSANNYQNEQSETWIGEWMADRKNRDLMVIATKFTTPYRNYAQGAGHTVNYCGNSKKSLHLSLRDSLKKLGTGKLRTSPTRQSTD